MARPKQTYPHGTVQRYRQGACDDVRGVKAGDRCQACREARAQYHSEFRAGIPPEQRHSAPDNVRSINGRKRSNTAPSQSNSHRDEPIVGPTEKAVVAQLEQYRDEQPIRFEMALNAARILDNPERVNIHHAARKDLEDVVGKLTAAKKKKSGGRLATVSAMAGRRSG